MNWILVLLFFLFILAIIFTFAFVSSNWAILLVIIILVIILIAILIWWGSKAFLFVDNKVPKAKKGNRKINKRKKRKITTGDELTHRPRRRRHHHHTSASVITSTAATTVNSPSTPSSSAAVFLKGKSSPLSALGADSASLTSLQKERTMPYNRSPSTTTGEESIVSYAIKSDAQNDSKESVKENDNVSLISNSSDNESESSKDDDNNSNNNSSSSSASENNSDSNEEDDHNKEDLPDLRSVPPHLPIVALLLLIELAFIIVVFVVWVTTIQPNFSSAFMSLSSWNQFILVILPIIYFILVGYTYWLIGLNELRIRIQNHRANKIKNALKQNHGIIQPMEAVVVDLNESATTKNSLARMEEGKRLLAGTDRRREIGISRLKRPLMNATNNTIRKNSISSYNIETDDEDHDDDYSPYKS